jgi:hypothetical protein
VILKLGKGVGRAAVKKAVAGKRPATFMYTGILGPKEIREAVSGILDSKSPKWSRPLLAWLASHPNTPEDVLRDLFELGDRMVLMSLALSQNLPSELKRKLLDHGEADVREHANHVFSKQRKH